VSERVQPRASATTLEEKEAQLRAQYRDVWMRARMAEEFRVRPRSLTEGRPASGGLMLFWLGLLGLVTWFLVDQGLRALSAEGPAADTIFAETVPGLLLVLTWCVVAFVVFMVFGKYRRLR